MNPMDPLAQLRDIHTPEPVGWWPLAWGWWLLIALLLGAAALCLWLLWRRRRANRYRRQALLELDVLGRHFRHHGDRARYLQDLSVLLRRTALSAAPREAVASLQGEQWLAWLDATLGPQQRGFREGPGQCLLQGPYQRDPELDAPALERLISRWIREHRVGGKHA